MKRDTGANPINYIEIDGHATGSAYQYDGGSNSCLRWPHCHRESLGDLGALGKVVAEISGIADAARCVQGSLAACAWVAAGITPVGKAKKAIDAAKGAKAAKKGSAAAKELSPKLRALSEAHITDSGETVLGTYVKNGGYIAKAKARGASYFDIGDAWNSLSRIERTAANNHFLDVIAARGDTVLLSVPRTKIRAGTTLAEEVAYLTRVKGYKFVNQRTLRPGG